MEVFDAIKNLRRRYVLYYLKQEDGAAELGDLAEQIAAWENASRVEEITADQRKSVYSALHQTHLPKLQSAGVVRYDSERGRVTLSNPASNLDLQLLSDSRTSLPWHKLYLALTALGLAAIVPALAGMYSVSVLALPYAGLIVALFGITLGHTYDLRLWQQKLENAAPDILLELND
jgi:hypothetical protein